jgi:Anti-sigma-K factor rskA
MRFDDVINGDGVTAEDVERLRRVHELLVAAGPVPDLSPALQRPPVQTAEVAEVTRLLRRRRGLAAVLALAAALALFAGGYVFGRANGKPAAFSAIRSVPMHGAGGSHGVIRLAAMDSGGNWPMLVQVSGLVREPGRTYYEVWLTKHGRPAARCGSFRVHGDTTSVRFSVPYDLAGYTGWVVTTEPQGIDGAGRIVLST